MSRLRRWASLAAGLGMLLCSASTLAQWELDNDHSSLNFISIKNARVAESHRFDRLVGFIGKDGTVQLGIDLGSVDTQIEIRDERMRELLFDTGRFPSANITAEVDPAILQTLQAGSVVTTDIDVTLSLHGQESRITVPVVVISESAEALRVISTRPVLVDAAEFDLVRGIGALREVAGLDSISNVVPVTFHLLFKPAPVS
jgi:polyisoprenoid-binding protein YceI